MDAAFWFEVVGYVASALVALSILQESILRLRVVGLVGAVVFIAYGLLIGAYPVALLNAVIAGIHLVYLRRLVRGHGESLAFLPARADDPYLERFLAFHDRDIRTFFGPVFAWEPTERTVIVFLLRDLVPAGLFAAERHGDELRVTVDYAIPRYRDLVLGRWLFDHLTEVTAFAGAARVVATAQHPDHADYLRRVGFVEAASGRWVRALA